MRTGAPMVDMRLAVQYGSAWRQRRAAKKAYLREIKICREGGPDCRHCRSER